MLDQGCRFSLGVVLGSGDQAVVCRRYLVVCQRFACHTLQPGRSLAPFLGPAGCWVCAAAVRQRVLAHLDKSVKGDREQIECVMTKTKLS